MVCLQSQRFEDLWQEDDEIDSSDDENYLNETKSQDAMNSQSLSVGSSYKPGSSQSTIENDSETIDPEQSADDFKIPFMFVIVMWTQIFKLLSKCQREGCGSSVLLDNMKFVTNGKYILFETYSSDIKRKVLLSKCTRLVMMDTMRNGLAQLR